MFGSLYNYIKLILVTENKKHVLLPMQPYETAMLYERAKRAQLFASFVILKGMKLLAAISLAALFVLAGCSASARFNGGRYASEEEYEKDRAEAVTENAYDVYTDYVPVDTYEGTASYYAHKYHGRLTANGETYNMYGYTAAHPDFPFGTILRVTNLKNNITVTLKINDRMPRHSERIIDLSLGAAEKLDMINDGLAEVRIEVLQWGNGGYRKD